MVGPPGGAPTACGAVPVGAVESEVVVWSGALTAFVAWSSASENPDAAIVGVLGGLEGAIFITIGAVDIKGYQKCFELRMDRLLICIGTPPKQN